MLGLEKIRNAIERVVVDEDRAEQCLLGFEVLRRHAHRRRGWLRQFADVRFGGCHDLRSEKSVSKVGVRRFGGSTQTSTQHLALSSLAAARTVRRASVKSGG